VTAANVHSARRPEVPEAPAELYDVFRVEAGVGRFGVDFGERDLPQEAGLTRVVSVEKGCYVGQETVARIHFRGHINKVLRPLTFDGVDSDGLVGRELRAGDVVVGRVTSAVRSPRNGVVGLGMVRVEPAEGAPLEVEGGGVATLGPLPEGTKVKTG
jgi:folate-binding protein YgfZ